MRNESVYMDEVMRIAGETNWKHCDYLLHFDTSQIKSGRIENKCVTGADMGDCLLQLSSKKVWVTFIFDCCFSGHMYRGPDFKKSDFRCMKAREVKFRAITRWVIVINTLSILIHIHNMTVDTIMILTTIKNKI